MSAPRGWLGRREGVLLLAVAAYLLSFFHRVAPTTMAEELSRDFNVSAASLGLLAATYFYVYTLMQVPTGVLADTLGPRRLLSVGGLIAGLGSLLFAWAPDFTLAAVGRTAVGLGVSVAFIAMLKLLAVWYEERLFATLTGLAMLVGNLGSMLAGAPLAWLMQDYTWRQIFAVTGVLSLLLAAASHLWVRDRPAGVTHPAATHEHASLWHALAEVLRNRQTWPGFFLTFGIGGGIFGFGGLWAGPFFTQAHGYTRALAANHMSLYFLGFALGCLFIGTLSDRLGRRLPVLRAGMALYALSWLVWLQPGPLPLALSYLMCAVMGLFTASLVLSWVCAKEVNPPQLSGMATSVVNVGAFLGGAIMQPLAGWVMDQYWMGEMRRGVRQYPPEAWRVMIGLMFGSTLLGAAATLFMRETGCRNIWRR